MVGVWIPESEGDYMPDGSDDQPYDLSCCNLTIDDFGFCPQCKEHCK